MKIQDEILDPNNPYRTLRATVHRGGFGLVVVTTEFGSVAFGSNGCWSVMTENEILEKQKKERESVA